MRVFSSYSGIGLNMHGLEVSGRLQLTFPGLTALTFVQGINLVTVKRVFNDAMIWSMSVSSFTFINKFSLTYRPICRSQSI